ncbi:MAG: OsmC family protein [Proteobacteria bacterium]|nr:OsmC family protein [Pseudomonadota bacterium]
MSKIEVSLFEKEQCKIVHQHSNTSIQTDGPFEWGGQGRTFSPTDLLAASLGSCILSILEPVFERNGYDSNKIKLTVIKELAKHPHRIKSLALTLSYPDVLEESFKQKAFKMLEFCPVKRALNTEVDVTIKFA